MASDRKLEMRGVLIKEIENLTDTIKKMGIAIENSKLDLQAAKIIKESLEDSVKTLPDQITLIVKE
jgi:hypothetical protein|tara:strand:+ start:1373 stop:1570 length:198 start_codon:yes stop_codon:yes gene_type:complete